MNALPNPWVSHPTECASDKATVSIEPETFLEYAQRRSMPLVSPPMAQSEAPQGEWPRGFDPEAFLAYIEPRPVFLDVPKYQQPPARRVKSSLLRALMDLAGPER